MKHIKTYKGIGEAELDSSKEKVSYLLNEYHELKPVETHDDPHGTGHITKSIVGKLVCLEKGSKFSLVLRGPSTLHLEDGKRLNFLVMDNDGHELRIESVGWFF